MSEIMERKKMNFSLIDNYDLLDDGLRVDKG